MTDESDFDEVVRAHNERARKLQAETKANMNINFSVDPPAPNYIKREDIKVGDRVRRTYTDTREGTVVFVAAPALNVVESVSTSSITFSTKASSAPTTHIYGAKFELLDRPKPKPENGSRWIVNEDSWASDFRNISTAFPKGTRLIYNSMSATYIVFDCAVEDSGLLGFVVPVNPKSPDDNVPFLKSLVPYGD